MSDIPWGAIATGASSVLKGMNSSAAASDADREMQDAYRQMLANLQARFGDYDALGKAGYQDITAQQVGPSALEGIPQDLQARGEQQASIAALQQLADNGGLSLADMQALNEIQRNLNQNTQARRKGLANDFAARGQLGSGAQLAMDLAGQSQAAESANQRGEQTAAQAQARALQAILQKGQVARGMSSDDYNRRAEAARAHDAIEARNAAARTDAAKTNNTYRGQAFEDELSKARGKTQLTGDMNKAVFGRGSQSANTRLAQGGFANSGIDSGVAAFNQLSGQGNTQGNTTVPNTPEWKDPGTASSPDEWNQFPDSSDGASKLGDEDDR